MTNNLESKGDLRLAYSVHEAAEMLGVSRAWIYGLWADGAGPKRTKIAGRTLILKDDLRSWLGAAMSNSRCAWCGNPFKARMNGGSMQIFCCKTHRYEFRLALIAHSQALLVNKKITMEDLRASKALADTAYKQGQWVRL